MKRVKKPVFFVVALLILALVVTSLFGVYGQHGDFKVTYIKGAGDIRWGIDIRGGVEATFSPADGVEATTEQLNAAKEIIETRMVSQSITDYEIYTDPTNNRIIVRFPWRSDEQDYDPEAAIDELAATAHPVIDLMPDQRDITNKGGTMRRQHRLPHPLRHHCGEHHPGGL